MTLEEFSEAVRVNLPRLYRPETEGEEKPLEEWVEDLVDLLEDSD